MKVKAAGIFIVNIDKKLLVCHPTNHSPIFWSIPKGKVEGLETFTEAAIRETFEETNIDLTDYSNKLISIDSQDYSHKKKVLHPFVLFEIDCHGLNLSTCVIKCNSNVPIERGGFPEMDGYRWVNLEDSKEMLHATQRDCIDEIIKMCDRR